MNKFRMFLNLLVCAVVIGLPVLGVAAPTLTIPDIDTTHVFSAAEKVFALVGIVIAIIVGLRLFKKA